MSTDGITVTGIGTVRTAPDTARIQLGVRVTDRTVVGAAGRAGRDATAITRALHQRGVDRDDIATSNYSVQPEYHYPPNASEPVLRGFTVMHHLVATLRDVDRIGEIIDAAVAAGGNSSVVEGISFGVDEPATNLADARDAAWADAVAKATQLAELAGLPLGPAIEIHEGTGGGPMPRPMMARAAMAMADDSTVIEPGRASTTVSLTVRFRLGGGVTRAGAGGGSGDGSGGDTQHDHRTQRDQRGQGGGQGRRNRS